MKFLLFLLFSILFNQQTWYNHPELNWYTFETEHFVFHYHDETKRTAMEAALVSEEVYYPITKLYNYEPASKTHIILKDVNDFSNGMAYYFHNKIEIWAMPLDYDLRGSHRWLQNVITHEFIHIVQLGASMKYGKNIPNMFLQMMSYEVEKRPDVLYGFPNKIISYPIPGAAVPPWLAEGTAQYMFEGANYDYWDSHRDMIVRDRVLNGNLLSFTEMNTFGKKGIGHESVYNQGFKLVEFMVEKYGEQSLRKISESLSKAGNYSINQAIIDATGNNSQSLYDEWAKTLLADYLNNTKHIQNSEFQINILEDKGTTNIHPKWSPSEEKFSYLSNKNNDFFGQTDLFIYNFIDSSSTKIVSGVKSTSTWLNDSTIIYSKHSEPNGYGSVFFDLYKYNINIEEETRLTYNSRLMFPIYIKKTNQIAAIKTRDGTSNIWISDVDSIKFTQITSFEDGTYIPSIDISDSQIIFTAITNQTRDIFSLDLSDSNIKAIYKLPWDTRSPTINNNKIIYSSDESGIFNLCLNDLDESTNIADNQCNYITNVLGGIFMPNLSKKGRLLYSIYDGGSYKIGIIDDIKILNEKIGYIYKHNINVAPSKLITAGNYNSNYIDSNYLFIDEITKGKRYKERMSVFSIVPKLMLDYNTLKPGFYFFTDDYLDKFSIFGGASLNKISDLDIFLMFEYKKFIPTFYTNLFWVTRHNNLFSYYIRENGDIVDNIHINSDLTFLIFSGEVGTRLKYNKDKFWLFYQYNNYREHVKQEIVQYGPYNDLKLSGEVAFDYYRGHIFSIKYDRDRIKSNFLKSMLPSKGYRIRAKIDYEINQFMDGFAVNEDHGTFGANFVPNNTFRIEFGADYHYTISDQNNITTSSSINLGWISNSNIDDFFYFFGGGLPGLKGYTFYEEKLTGPTKMIFSNITRVPVIKEANINIAHMIFQNLSIGIVNQIGRSFQNNDLSNDSQEYLLSHGLELRLSGFSFFAYPTAINYEYHIPGNFENDSKGKHYLNILFDFELGF